MGFATGDKESDQLQRFLHRSELTDRPELERNIEANQDRIRNLVPEGIARPGRSEVRRRERTYQDRSTDDEVDAVMSGSDRTVIRKQIGMEGSYGGDLLRSVGRTGEWVEEHMASSGIEDLDMQSRYTFLRGVDSDDAQNGARLSQTTATIGLTDDNQVRIIKISFLLF